MNSRTPLSVTERAPKILGDLRPSRNPRIWGHRSPHRPSPYFPAMAGTPMRALHWSYWEVSAGGGGSGAAVPLGWLWGTRVPCSHSRVVAAIYCPTSGHAHQHLHMASPPFCIAFLHPFLASPFSHPPLAPHFLHVLLLPLLSSSFCITF